MSNESSYTWIVPKTPSSISWARNPSSHSSFGCYTAIQADGHNHYPTFFIDLKKVWLPDSQSHIPCEKREVRHQWAERSDVFGEETYSSWLTARWQINMQLSVANEYRAQD